MRRFVVSILILQFLCAAVPVRIECDGGSEDGRRSDRSTDWLWCEIFGLFEESETDTEDDELSQAFGDDFSSLTSERAGSVLAAPLPRPHRLDEIAAGEHSTRGPPPLRCCR